MTHPILGAFVLDDEIKRFPPEAAAAGRRAETLIKSDGLRVVLVTLCAGIALHEHTAPGPITIQAVRGRFTVTAGGAQHDLAAGAVIAIEAGARHAVHAVEDGAFLLTIAWAPARDAG